MATAATQPLFGLSGQLDEVDGRLICHVCGRGYKWLPAHTRQAHGIPADEYREEFGLARQTSLSAPGLHAWRSQDTLRRQQIGMLGRYPKGRPGNPASAPHRGPGSLQTRRAMSTAHLAGWESVRPRYLRLRTEAVVTIGGQSGRHFHRELRHTLAALGMLLWPEAILRYERRCGFLGPAGHYRPRAPRLAHVPR